MELVQDVPVVQSTFLKVQYVHIVDLEAPLTLFQELALDHQLINAPLAHSSISLLNNVNVHLINLSTMVLLVLNVIFLYIGIGITIIVQVALMVNTLICPFPHVLDAQLDSHLIFHATSVFLLLMYAQFLVSTSIPTPINVYV
jgi:hypothetical protein